MSGSLCSLRSRLRAPSLERLTTHRARRAAHYLALCLALAGPAAAQRQPSMPRSEAQDRILKEVRLDQKLKAQVPLDLVFTDETGRPRPLSDFFEKKPVMLVLIQYRCTMLCSEQMNVLLESLKQMRFSPGDQFTLLIATIDPREEHHLASEKKKHYLDAYGRGQAAAGWHWLTGDEASIRRLADAVGFRYVYDAHTDQYAHPDGVIILTPEGKVARYFMQLEYPARDLQFGLMEAANRRIGSPIDAFALWCYHYNPVTGKYGLAVMKLVRMGALATLLALLAGIVLMRGRERRGIAPARPERAGFPAERSEERP